MTELDKAFCRVVKKETAGFTPEKIVLYFFTNFVVKNRLWYERITKEWNLPSDFLKAHKKIISLA